MKLSATNRCRLIISVIIPLFVMLSPGFSATAAEATSAENIKQETAELLEALKAYSTEQRDAAVEQSRIALENLDQRIDALEIQMLDQWDEMERSQRRWTASLASSAGDPGRNGDAYSG